MSFKKLVSYKNSHLRNKSLPVNFEVDDVESLKKDLIYNADFYHAVGLSAIQIDVPLQTFVYKELSSDEYKMVVNPQIIEISEETVRMQEGCLSFPNAYTVVTRPSAVKVSFHSELNELIETELFGQDGRVFLHEYDHLQGILMTDLVSNMKKDMLTKKADKFLKDPRFGIFFV